MDEYIIVKNTCEQYVDEIYKILFRCGLNMAQKGMFHWLKPYSKKQLRNDCDTKIVVLVKDSVTGECTSTFQMYVNNVGNLYVRKIATSPKYEGKGIGRRNMQYMENFAREQGCLKICLDVYRKSSRAICFYQKFGFKIVGETKARFFREYVMEKIINS